MNRNLYNAASKGNVDVLRQHIDQLEIQTTSKSNTALHVAVQFGQLQCVAEILQVCPLLLRRKNIKEETPLHMAAREGYANIVKVLVERAKNVEQELESGWGGAAKEVLRATNVDGDTALHMAVRNCHLEKKKYLEVVKLLTREDPEFQHLANNAEETPLYLAAERGSKGVAMLDALLEAYTSSTYGGPAGRTALHAAILNDFTGQSTNRLLKWKKDLIKETDMNGWTPLQCAACNGNTAGVKELLKIDEAGLYDITTNIDGQETALHIAAAHGYEGIMEDILSYYPDCWEMVNSKGQNVLHLAMDMDREMVIKFIIKKPWLCHLINQKDDEGNTPLHLFMASDCVLGELWMHLRADREVFNDKNLTPEEMMLTVGEKNSMLFSGDNSIFNSRCTSRRNIASNAHDHLAELKRLRKVGKEAAEDSQKAYQTLVIVAALIATISFAAAFTIPGGYDGNQGPEQGMAVLSRSSAFKAFLITNTLALVCSVTSVFLCMTATFYTNFGRRSEANRAGNRYSAASILIFVALVAMMLAFITASFAVLAHSVALSVFTCIIACIPFLIFSLELRKMCFWRPIARPFVLALSMTQVIIGRLFL